MSLADELSRLHTLRELGSLTDEEFSRAKALLLAQDAVPASNAPPFTIASVELQIKIQQLDDQWNQRRISLPVHFTTLMILFVVTASFLLFRLVRSVPARPPFLMYYLAFVVVAGVLIWRLYLAWKKFQDDYYTYKWEREQLVAQLQSLGNQPTVRDGVTVRL